MSPVLIVIAGPNGAGKTTVTKRLRADQWSEGVEYINPDDIARDRFGDWNSPDAIMKAASWAATRREGLLAAGAGVAFETVLSAPDELQFIQRARRSLANVPALISLAHRVYLFDNSREDQDAILCVRTQDGAIRKVYGPLPAWVDAVTLGAAPRERFEDLRASSTGR